MSETVKKRMPPSIFLWLLCLTPWISFAVLAFIFATTGWTLTWIIPVLCFIAIYFDAWICGKYDYYLNWWVELGMICPIIYPFVRISKTTKKYLPAIVMAAFFALDIVVALIQFK